jgi:hypothetical protein
LSGLKLFVTPLIDREVLVNCYGLVAPTDGDDVEIAIVIEITQLRPGVVIDLFVATRYYAKGAKETIHCPAVHLAYPS